MDTSATTAATDSPSASTALGFVDDAGTAHSAATDRLFTVRLPVALHDALRARAQQEDRRLAQTLRAALRAYLEAEPREG